MKKHLKILIIVLLVILNINVYAEDAWPRTINHNDFTISIEGFDLRIYKADADSPKKELVTTTEDGATITETTTEDGEKYINEIPTKIINLNASDFTIDPEFKDEKFLKVNTSFINLKLNLTKEKLQELLSEEYNQVSENRGYLVELVVNYKVTSYPDKYAYTYKYNFFHDLVGAFSTSYHANNTLDTSKTNYQVLNMIALRVKEGTEEKEIFYETTLTDDHNKDVSVYVLNYQLFSEVKDASDESKSTAIMFHNVSNIEYLIENINKIETYSIDREINPITSTMIKVPNTAAYKPNMFYIIGGILIMYGIVFLFFATYNNKKKSYNN